MWLKLRVTMVLAPIFAPVAPKTVGNMLNNPTSTTMSTLLKVCDALELNLTAILHSIESGLISNNTKLFYDISNPAYSGYTGEYHVFFLSTIPNKDAHMEKPLIHGTLKLGDLHSVHECTAILDIDSGDIGKNGEQFTKHYEGVLVYSSNTIMFCNLIGNEYGDMWFLVFNHGNLNSNELACVLGCAATSSSGRTTRYPAIHRFCLCNKQKYPVISDETKRRIQGLLRLQNNELYVKKENVQAFLARTDLDPTFRKNLENYLNCKNRRRFATCTEKTCHPAGLFFPPRRRFGHTQPYLSPTFLEWSYSSSQSAETSKTSLSRSDGLR